MTKREFAVLADAINTIFPGTIPNVPAMQIWFSALEPMDIGQAQKAFAEHLRKSHFPPKPADFWAFAGRVEVHTDTLYETHVLEYLKSLQGGAQERRSLPKGDL